MKEKGNKRIRKSGKEKHGIRRNETRNKSKIEHETKNEMEHGMER